MSILNTITSLELKLAMADFKEYKKEHPGTKKTPSDPMFEGSKNKEYGHLSHKDFETVRV